MHARVVGGQVAVGGAHVAAHRPAAGANRHLGAERVAAAGVADRDRAASGRATARCCAAASAPRRGWRPGRRRRRRCRCRRRRRRGWCGRSAAPFRRAAAPRRTPGRRRRAAAGSARRTGRRRRSRPAGRRGRWPRRGRAGRRCRSRASAIPKRVKRRLTTRRPTLLVASTKKRPSLRKYESDSVSRFITSRSLSPSPSTSAACTPMPALARAVLVDGHAAQPAPTRRSASAALVHPQVVGRAVVGDEDVDGRPSPSTSSATTPRPLPRGRGQPGSRPRRR